MKNTHGKDFSGARRLWILTALWLLALAFVFEAMAQDWPEYRGPARDGVLAKTELLASWPEEGPKLLWRHAIGDGFSAVSGVGDRLFTMAIVDTEEGPRDALLALDSGSGEELWRVTLGEPVTTEFGDGPRSTPSLADGRVFAISSRSLLVAVDMEGGDELWRRDLLDGGEPPRFGYSSSPLVDGDRLIVEAGSPDPGRSVVAFDVASGRELWRALDGAAGYASPLAVELAGVRQYVFARRQGPEVVALSTDGEVLWRHGTTAMTAIPMPVFVAPDQIFISASDDDFGGLMLRVTPLETKEAGSAFQVEEIWRERLMRNHFNTSVAVGDFVYGFDNATFKCLDAETGERRWAKRGFGKGSLIAAGETLVVLSDTGQVALVEAKPEAYVEVGRFRASRGKAWTAPSLHRGRLLIRDQDEIAAFAVGREVAAAGASREKAEVQSKEIDPRLLEILDRYAAARGGKAAWQSAKSLRLRGEFAAFSENGPFTLIRRRPDQYRLDFTLLGAPATRARSGDGPWMLHKLLSPEAAAVTEDPYLSQLERESHFEPLLLSVDPKRVRFDGAGDIEGQATWTLTVRLSDIGEEPAVEETWHLDAETYLEVAVDSQVYDFTQLPRPMRQRIFYDDFRRVDGLVLPHRLDWEFGARLETMAVEEAEINPPLGDSDFDLPVAEAPATPP